MIAGIGTDMVDIQRIAQVVARGEHFKLKVFAPDEIAYCDAQRHPAQHYAARWAVKEAYLKAFGVEFITGHDLSLIVTCKDELGKPYLELRGKEKERFDAKQLGAIHVSLSHTDTLAMAYVIIEKLN
ncbi:MAG: holo-ACP synthase [Chitinophagaceae bacterium]